ncbi:hypothetical protein G7Y89_g112 [Cudoniella acicularis]|uniref:RING-type E3 ubiquitin transferase n=1 Tax=Cudoniella acicularis TaxID=354080 RepID=A0A8H4RZH1_9HELO|nr:hypothetical protein G7Y89_g112 [Cudoniella acicularis]
MPEQPPQRRDHARNVLIILLLFVLYTSDNQGPAPGFPSARDHAAERVIRSRHSLDVLNATRWRDFAPKTKETKGYDVVRYLNLTGFREADEFAWEKLGSFKERSAVFSREVRKGWKEGGDENLDLVGLRGEVYENVTGIVKGTWVRSPADGVKGKEPKKRVMNLTEISPGVDWAFKGEEYWTRNITGKEGTMRLKIDERDVLEMDLKTPMGADKVVDPSNIDLVREVSATVTIQDETSNGDGWEMKIHGVHWPRMGIMLMTTTSEKFAGIFGLPHLTPGPEFYTSSQILLNSTLETTVERMEKAVWIDPSNPWSSSPESQGDAMMPVPHCEFVVYVQVHPVQVDWSTAGGFTPVTDIVKEIERELRFPNGAPLPVIPRLQMSTVMFSPDCGFMLESKGPPAFSPVNGEHLVGKKQELWLHNIQNWLLMLALILFGQIQLLKIQSKEASTPSTVGRVSFYTIGGMLLADAFFFSGLSLLSATAPNLFPSALLASFAAFLSVILGVKFLGAIHSVQEPERIERLRAQLAAQATSNPSRPATVPTTAPIITPAGTDTAPPAATSSSPGTINGVPIINPSDQDVDTEIAQNTATEPLLPTTNVPAPTPAATQTPQPQGTTFGAVYAKFVITLTLLMFISASAVSWPVSIRNGYVNLLAFAYLSMWVPQIRRNIARNCRKALLWKYVVGQSALRLLPFAYFYLKEGNILFSETDWKAFCVLAGWVWLQIWILVAQEVLGPRWGIPRGWTEQGWDYHPILREDNVEAGGLPIGLVQIPASPTIERTNTGEDPGSRKKKDGTFRSVDCAICMQALEVPVVAAGEDASSTAGVAVFRGLDEISVAVPDL